MEDRTKVDHKRKGGTKSGKSKGGTKSGESKGGIKSGDTRRRSKVGSKSDIKKHEFKGVSKGESKGKTKLEIESKLEDRDDKRSGINKETELSESKRIGESGSKEESHQDKTTHGSKSESKDDAQQDDYKRGSTGDVKRFSQQSEAKGEVKEENQQDDVKDFFLRGSQSHIEGIRFDSSVDTTKRDFLYDQSQGDSNDNGDAGGRTKRRSQMAKRRDHKRIRRPSTLVVEDEHTDTCYTEVKSYSRGKKLLLFLLINLFITAVVLLVLFLLYSFKPDIDDQGGPSKHTRPTVGPDDQYPPGPGIDCFFGRNCTERLRSSARNDSRPTNIAAESILVPKEAPHVPSGAEPSTRPASPALIALALIIVTINNVAISIANVVTHIPGH